MAIHRNHEYYGASQAVANFVHDIDGRSSIGNWRVQGIVKIPTYRGKTETRKFVRIGAGPEVELFLASDVTSVKVSNIIDRVQGLEPEEYNRILDDWSNLADPIARQHGLAVEAGATEIKIERFLSIAAYEKFDGFELNANKSTGTGHPLDKERWLEFVVQAHRDKCALSGHQLERYLVDERSWPQVQAADLAVQYDRGRDLLEHYDQKDETP
jgi:hypothetical protein